MDTETLDRFNSFSLSAVEAKGVELEEEDTKIGFAEGKRSLIERVFGGKKSKFPGS